MKSDDDGYLEQTIGQALGVLCPVCGNGLKLCATKNHERIAALEQERNHYQSEVEIAGRRGDHYKAEVERLRSEFNCPTITDDMGRERYRPNEIVRVLLDEGPLTLNDIAVRYFEPEDRRQFWKLLGYSLDGYEELDSSLKEALGDDE